MIRQNEAGWAADDRERHWTVHDLGGSVLARKYAVEPLEADYPPTVELSADEWAQVSAGGPGGTVLDTRMDALVWPRP
jgi:hypothetical protein